MTGTSPRLTGLDLAADPERWRALGFAVDGRTLRVGGVEIRFVDGDGDGEQDGDGGLVGWHLDESADPPPATPTADTRHENGATEIDHVVLMTPDLDATVDELAGRGFEARRTRDAGGGVTQVFYRLGGPILEVIGPVAQTTPRLWGVVFTVDDLDATYERLGDTLLTPPKDAVQPGRRIATVKSEAQAGTAVAFMSPPLRSPAR